MGARAAQQSNKAYKFYQQDLQLQTEHSDGKVTVDQIVQASIANGRKIIGITDHAIGWDEADEHCVFFKTAQEFKKYLADIAAAKHTYSAQGITVLAGLEVEIGFEGQMALGEGILAVIGNEENLTQYVDYVIGVIHSESFTVSLDKIGKKAMDEKNSELLIKNMQALINNPQVLIWGHPFQAIHGHYMRNLTKPERAKILTSLKHRKTPLFLEYNLNATPRYTEWNGKSTYYENGQLVPNDMLFFEECAKQGSTFVLSTDAHDEAQTARLNKQTVIPTIIKDRLVYIGN